MDQVTFERLENVDLRRTREEEVAVEKDVEDEEVEKGMAEEKVLEHGDGDNGGGAR